MGRPTVMTPETIDKLRQAYLIGATNEEAAHYANISARTIYEYIEKNPEFSQQIHAWKSEPILKAKQMAVRGIEKDIKNAHWYLERRAKKEYGSNVDVTSDGEKLEGLVIIKTTDEDKS